MSVRSASLALIALLIAGCGTTTSAGNFQGPAAKVAATIDALSSAAQSHDSTKICTQILAPAITARLKAKGGSCPNVVAKQLDTVDTFNVTVQKVTIDASGTTARAQVQSTSNGKPQTSTLGLIRLPDGTWRIASPS